MRVAGSELDALSSFSSDNLRPRRLVGPRFGSLVGCVYGAALLITVASVDLGAAGYAWQIFESGDPGAGEQLAIAAALIFFHTLLNLLGVGATAVVTNLGLAVEVLMTLVMGVLLLALPGHGRQPASFLASRETPAGDASTSDLLGALLAHAFVFFGFESAAVVSEEVTNPKRSVPRAIVTSLLGASLVTGFLQIALAAGFPAPAFAFAGGDVDKCEESAVSETLKYHFGDSANRVLSSLLIVAYVSCAGAAQASTSRLIYAFARDGRLPASRWLQTVSPSSKTPVNATLVAAMLPLLIAFTVLIPGGGDVNVMAVIVGYSVIGIYAAFQLVVFGYLYRLARDGRWVAKPAPGDEHFFALGRFAVPVAVFAQLYGVAMIVNLLWPRPPLHYLSIAITAVFLAVSVAIAIFYRPAGAAAHAESEQPLLLSTGPA